VLNNVLTNLHTLYNIQYIEMCLTGEIWFVFFVTRTQRDELPCSYKYCLYNQEYRGADKSLARPTSRCILFDGKNISFDASLVAYIKIVLIFLQL